MIGSNKITQGVNIGQRQQPFENHEDIGLFTFYKLQESNQPLCLNKAPLPSIFNNQQRLPQKRSKTEGTRSEIHKTTPKVDESQNECDINEPKLVKSKASQVLKCRLQLISDNNFEARSVRKNTTNHTNLIPCKIRTEMYSTHQSSDFRESEQIVQLIRIKEVTSEEVKQLFQPKRKAINRFISSRSNSSIQEETEHIKVQKIKPPCINTIQQPFVQPEGDSSAALLSAKTTTEIERSTKKAQQLSFLDYLYRQKSLISDQYAKLRHKKKLQQIVVTVQARQKIFKQRKFNNSPLRHNADLSKLKYQQKQPE